METAHVVPLNDLVGHEIAIDCPCGPLLERGWIDDAPAWIVIHHALDGRKPARDA